MVRVQRLVGGLLVLAGVVLFVLVLALVLSAGSHPAALALAVVAFCALVLGVRMVLDA